MPIAMQYGNGKYAAQQQASGGGSAGGITMTLLWTNPDPTADFGAQTIPLDLSGYDAVLVQCGTSGGGLNDENTIPIGESGRVQYAGYTGANARIYMRDITVTSTGVTFSICGRFTQGTSGVTNVVTALKCLRIYGIKGIT